MRFGKLTALTGILIMIAAGMYGCSDDKSTSTPAITYGPIDDPVFVPVKAQIDDAITTFVNDMRDGFENYYVAPGDWTTIRAQMMPPAIEPDLGADPETLIVIYQNDWHFVYATFLGDAFRSRVACSTQYQIDGIPVEDPQASVDFIHDIDNWRIMALDTDISHTNYTGRNDFQIANLDQNTATINGVTSNTVEIVYVDADSTMSDVYSFVFTVNNINVPRQDGEWESGCPCSGTLQMTLSHTYNWDNSITFGTGADGWNINVVFTNGIATVTADNGSDVWLYDIQVCTAP